MLTKDCENRLKFVIDELHDTVVEYKERIHDSEFESAEDTIADLLNHISDLIGITNICEAQSKR